MFWIVVLALFAITFPGLVRLLMAMALLVMLYGIGSIGAKASDLGYSHNNAYTGFKNCVTSNSISFAPQIHSATMMGQDPTPLLLSGSCMMFAGAYVNQCTAAGTPENECYSDLRKVVFSAIVKN